MKKIVLIVTLVFGFTSVFAQDGETSKDANGFQKGNVFLTGSIGIDNEKQGDTKENGFTVSPRAAYFISDNVALGVALGFNSIESDRFFINKTTGFSAGVFGRYYFTPSNEFSIFTELGAGYVTLENEIGTDKSKFNGFDVGFRPGVNYFISDAFALEAAFGVLSYSSIKEDFSGAEANNTFSFGLDLSDVSLGLVYRF